MIEVDDTGWGSLVGGTLIAAYRIETKEFHSEEIPVRFFQSPLFEEKAYLAVAADCAEKAVAALAPTPGESVRVCQGFIHATTHQRHPEWGVGKITGPLQPRIEQELKFYLHRLGFPYSGSTEDYGKLFWASVCWLKDGNPNRWGMNPDKMRLAKSGWSTWTAYRDYPYAKAKIVAKNLKGR